MLQLSLSQNTGLLENYPFVLKIKTSRTWWFSSRATTKTEWFQNKSWPIFFAIPRMIPMSLKIEIQNLDFNNCIDYNWIE